MTKSLILAGGCFWCVEHDMHEAHGVTSVTSGYSGGETENPTYQNHSGHREVILVEYDESRTTYKKLLEFFIDHIDPTDNGGQFADRGASYRSAIFYETDAEKIVAEGVVNELDRSGVYTMSSVVDILLRKPFFKAEEEHQNYAEKNPTHYNAYRVGSGRESFVNRTCALREEKHIVWSE